MSLLSSSSHRLKARRPKGFEDKNAHRLHHEQALIIAAHHVYGARGFAPLQTPALEYAELIGKFLPDQDRPNAGVFALKDDQENWLALRYDLTAPLARYVAENFDRLPRPFRRYQIGPVWRNEKADPGRYREFIQCDADTVGAPGAEADADMAMTAADVLEAACAGRTGYSLRLSDRRLLDGLLHSLTMKTGDGSPGYDIQKLRVMRAIDKRDRLGPDAVAELLGEGRRDSSGDFTKGAGLSPQDIDRVLRFVEAGQDDRVQTLSHLERTLGHEEKTLEGLQALRRIDHLLEACDYAPQHIFFDPSIVRGLDYYTGPVFEAELLMPEETVETSSAPSTLRLGSVGGGGRYDDLVARFRGQPAPATGFSLGVSRFATAMTLLEEDKNTYDDNLIIILPLDADHMADYFTLAAQARAGGIKAEVYLGGSGMRAQMKYADRRRARFALLVGEDERKAYTVTLKDLKAGAEDSKTIQDRESWRTGQIAQITLPRDQWVEHVRKHYQS